MARSIEPALEETIKLLRWDPAGDEYVRVRQARGRELREAMDHTRRVAYEHPAGENLTRTVVDWSEAELRVKQCWLVTVDCSLHRETPDPEHPGKSEKKRVFSPGMTYDAFKREWDDLPGELMDEWYEAVLKLNPRWDIYGLYAEAEQKN